ncbi:hypothetical protein [Shewanella youngdeokensis]|uniref:Uncharacterized protein n=1 Tax=Shewanella youngdeokensis TaxID=2999068 RepID=A0ABZ0JZX4_9GAMM|nr:hypothetical protein RGE70_02545 [Shewanella sp. DAU334]
MAKVRVKQEDSLSIKFLHQMEAGDNRRLDLYLFLPKEMGVNPQSIDEEEYYHSSITGRRSYYSSGLHLPLVQSRFVSQKKRTVEEFRLYLNLFAYQFSVAIETDSKELAQVEDLAEFYASLEELSEQVIHLLKRFRRNEPSDEKWKSYFENADNYLSWFCEQRLLKLLAHAPRSSEYAAVTESVIALCKAEAQYRQTHKYNSSKTIKDANRIANKMHLLRRLIQQGVVLKEDLKPLGVGLKRMTTGVATAMIMIVVSTLIIKAQGVFSGLTIALVLTLAVIYGFREIFKDEVRNALWRIIQRGRPRWGRLLQDTTSKITIAKQLVWLDFIRKKELPEQVTKILKRRHSQNKVDAEILHYGIHTRVSAKGFLAGYSQIQEQVNFSFVPFARNLERGKAKIYKELDGKISNESVERRYQVNLILSLKEGRGEPQFARYKITMNRSTIIEITESDLPSGVNNMDETPFEEELLEASAELKTKP